MGLVRLLLAIAVVFAHTPIRHALTGGRLAVEAFFMISGFYVALVLEKSYSRPADFYVNRYLRLAPAYWVVALLSLISWLALGVKPFPESIDSGVSFGPATWAFLSLANATMFFQDAVMFACDSTVDGLHFATDFHACRPPLYGALLVPQAWSLGVELAFYACAPWLMRLQNRWLLGLVAVSMVIKLALFFAGFAKDPWDYRFFPSEIFLFLLGSLSYRLRGKIGILSDGRAYGLKVFGMIAFCLIYSKMPFGSAFYYLFLILLFVSLPALLDFSSRHFWDRKIGELSYPIYLSHVLVISWLQVFAGELGAWSFSAVAILGTCVFSFVLYQFVDVPMEHIRAHRRASGRVSLAGRV